MSGANAQHLAREEGGSEPKLSFSEVEILVSSKTTLRKRFATKRPALHPRVNFLALIGPIGLPAVPLVAEEQSTGRER